MQREDAPTVEEYITKLVNYMVAVRGLFADFLTVAEKCAKLLAEDNGADPLQGLKLPAELVVKSRDVSPGLAELYRRIEYREIMDKDPILEHLEESKRKDAEARRAATEANEKAKKVFEEAKVAADSEACEKAASDAKDATAKPDPPASSS